MKNMKKINFTLAITTLFNSLVTSAADFSVGNSPKSPQRLAPGSFSGTTILAAVIIIVIILILLYIKFAKRNKSKN